MPVQQVLNRISISGNEASTSWSQTGNLQNLKCSCSCLCRIHLKSNASTNYDRSNVSLSQKDFIWACNSLKSSWQVQCTIRKASKILTRRNVFANFVLKRRRPRVRLGACDPLGCLWWVSPLAFACGSPRGSSGGLEARKYFSLLMWSKQKESF